MSDVRERVRSIASDTFNVPPEQLTDDASPETIEGWDSVQHLGLVLALEQSFGVRIDPGDIERMQTIGAICTLMEERVG